MTTVATANERMALTIRLIDFEPLYKRAVELEEQSMSYLRDKGVADEDFRVWSAVLAERTAFKHDIMDAPTVDAVPVVRCADCKWFQCNTRPDGYLPNGVDEYECRHWCGWCDPTDFCSYGERKE